jgi:dUTP pyrophosphatase
MDKKRVKIKRFDASLPLPEFKTEGAAAFDLCARIAVEILPKTLAYVPLNVAIETPPDHFLMLVARSSTHKKGLWMANGIGIGDPDFSGNDDEYKAVYYNFTDQPVVIEKGERIAQGLIIKREPIAWEEVVTMENKTRGGFGTTGNK